MTQTYHEPESKNTAPQYGPTFYALKRDPNAILLIAPSDQIISDTPAFHQALLRGLPNVEAGEIITFGIKPKRPETGYGYLELNEESSHNPVKLKSFSEKPSRDVAFSMIKSKFLWNAGIFMFKAKDSYYFENILQELLVLYKNLLKRFL